MLNFIRKRKKPTESPPEVILEEEREETKESEEVKNTDEIDKNYIETKEDEIMNEEKEEEVKIEEKVAAENDNAIKEEESAEEKFEAMAKAFATERNIAESDMEAGIKVLKDIRDGWMSGELTTDMLALVMRGLEYDKAVKEAREAGEIAGRNTQIEEKYMRPIESDGLPHLAGSNVRKNSTRISSIFDLARHASQV
ncbi:MAG: hypothetical protein K2M93_07185 [Muribaculaceae bacterium]|nr:hypothetical protein [Muribaculaceae bacterium]